MVYLKSVENVITLGKLIGLLFLFCFPLPSILFLKTPKIRGITALEQLYHDKKKRSLRN